MSAGFPAHITYLRVALACGGCVVVSAQVSASVRHRCRWERNIVREFNRVAREKMFTLEIDTVLTLEETVTDWRLTARA